MSNPTTSTTVSDGGLVLSATATITKFLSAASTNPNISAELQTIAISLLSQHPTVPYKPLKSIWLASDPKTRPNFTHLFSGSGFVFTSPKPREKSAELQARLKKLSEAAERKAYDELVKDVAPKRSVEEPFSAYKDQLGFGMHVALTMFTGYLVGFFAFRALFSQNVAMSAAGGILGLVVGMIVETLLFMIRTSSQNVPSVSSKSRIKKTQ
ncbi:hypothetical protein Leryth_003926 [Lithospermum erythrorhizon]|nr:hypothetical protein Leryth_003926 [Lithospermum erythrorhizon]